MSGLNSIGDLARFTQLRQANTQLKTKLAVLSEEASSGLKSDVAAATGGHLGRLAQVESRLTTLESYGRNASMAQSDLAGLQAALGAIGDIAGARGIELQAAQTLSDETSISVRAYQAVQDFHAVVRMMNTDVGGRFPMSGTEIGSAPLSPAQDILDMVRARVSGLTDPAAMSAAVDDWFEVDFPANAFHGNTDPTTVGVSPDATVAQGINAPDPAFRSVLKGLALATLAADPALAPTRQSQAALLARGGQSVVRGHAALTDVRAGVGMQQAIVAEASTRNAAERSALSIARTDILSADPYESAAALSQAETSLQNLYAITARMSRLSLTDYIK